MCGSRPEKLCRKEEPLRTGPFFFVVVIKARIGSNSPVLARTAYPVVGLYPVVKCKVVMLLVAGSS